MSKTSVYALKHINKAPRKRAHKLETQCFESYDVVLEKIKKLRASGYDRIHLPGGTSKDGAHYAGGVVCDYDSVSEKVYFVGVPYSSNFHKGNENGHNKKLGETPEQTFIRELMEETALQTTSDDLKLIFEKVIPDNRHGMEGKSHSKLFYLVQKYTGCLFTFDGPNPIDGETAAPLLIPADLFIEVIFGGHLPAVKNAIEELMNEKEEYYWALKNLIK